MILVTGSEGNVGSYAHEIFENTLLTGKTDLDVTGDLSMIGDLRPEVVLHLAALTDVDYCQGNPNQAFRVNAEATRRLAIACANIDAKLVYVSTAGVFSGKSYLPYIESDQTIPANVYGDSKLAGEYGVRTMCPGALIVRSGWMFGGTNDRKFVGKIIQQISDGAKELRAVDDKIGSPTYAPDLLLTVRNLLEADQTGVFHAANAGVASRYEVACHIRDLVDPDLPVIPVKSSEFSLPAPRADSEAMDHEGLRNAGIPLPRSWQDALTEYVKEKL